MTTLVRASRLAVLAFACFLFAVRLSAQEGGSPEPANSSPPVFRLGGTSTMEGQYSDRQGLGQEVPRNYARWLLDPTLFLFEIPFSVHMLLSTEQSINRQNINSFNLSFNLNTQQLQDLLQQRVSAQLSELVDRPEIQQLQAARGAAENPEQLKDSLRQFAPDQLADLERLEKLEGLKDLEPEELADHLADFKALDLVSGAERFIFNFPTLGIGVNYPSYSPTYLSGVPVTGVDIEFSPGKFYLAATGGKSQSAIVAADSSRFTYQRNLYAGKIGFGRKSGSHVYLTGLYAKDDDASALVVDSSVISTAPQANYILGVEGKIPFVERYFTIEGELLGSILTGDTRSPEIASNDIPSFLKDIIKPNVSTSLDLAYTAKAQVDIREIGTKVSAGVKRIGSGFYSLGAPYLRNDVMRIEGKVEQSLLKRQIMLAGFLRTEHDNLLDWKSATTTTTSFGVNLGLNFRGYPYLRLSYVPYVQTNDRTDNAKIDNRTTVMSAAAGYSVKIGEIQSTTGAFYSRNDTKTIGGAFDYGTNTFAINEAVSFAFPLTLSGGFNLVQPTIGSDTLRVTAFDFAGSYTAFEIWQNSVGMNIANQGTFGSKVGFFVASSIPLWDVANFEVRAEKNTFDDDLFRVSTYDEVVVRATLSSVW